jgi:ferredoxin
MMTNLEQQIKEYVNEQGVEVVGLAGPDRLIGPPSLDPTYIMSGAKSIVSMALPFHTGAIYDYLSKKSPLPHTYDHLLKIQRMNRISKRLADYLVEQGYQAEAVAVNLKYRRSPDLLSMQPDFSHRYGAIVSGIAAHGWSGNVKTKEYGAGVVLGTVVTNAELQSDPLIPSNYFIDNNCKKCRRCVKSCPSGMFDAKEEDQVLINGELHTHSKRLNLNLCVISCFGLHSPSPDKKFSSWGRHWIDEWLIKQPNPEDRLKLCMTIARKFLSAGDSVARYELERRVCSELLPEELMDEFPMLEELPVDETDIHSLLRSYVDRVGLKDLGDIAAATCGHCAIICGPTPEETDKRYRTLINSGLVVPGPNGSMVRVDTFEEAAEMRRRYLKKTDTIDTLKETISASVLFPKLYFGIDPKSIIQGLRYNMRFKEARRRQKETFVKATQVE